MKSKKLLKLIKKSCAMILSVSLLFGNTGIQVLANESGIEAIADDLDENYEHEEVDLGEEKIEKFENEEPEKAEEEQKDVEENDSEKGDEEQESSVTDTEDEKEQESSSVPEDEEKQENADTGIADEEGTESSGADEEKNTEPEETMEEETAEEETTEEDTTEEETTEPDIALLTELEDEEVIEIDGSDYISQLGGMESFEEDDMAVFELSNNYAQIEDAVVNAYQNWDPLINIKEFGIVYEKSEFLRNMSEILERNPELFFAKGSWGISKSTTSGVIISIRLNYLDAYDQNDYKEYLNARKQVIDDVIENDMSDVQKARTLHDWLARHIAYDDSLENRNVYQALIEGSAVCQGYACAYADLLRQVGIDWAYCKSKSMNHMWNYVKIDDAWYHVDVTWDDPTKDRCGFVRYNYFLNSDDLIKDPEKHSGWNTNDIECDSATYDDAWWQNAKSAILYDDGKEIYIKGDPSDSSNISLVKRAGSNEETLTDITDKWPVEGQPGYSWKGYFGALSYDNGYYFYSVPKKIYRFTLTDSVPMSIYQYNNDDGYIYGCMVENKVARLTIGTKPNESYSVKTVQLTDMGEVDQREIPDCGNPKLETYYAPSLRLGDIDFDEDANGAWAWEKPDTAITKTGVKYFKAVYTPNDIDNYMPVTRSVQLDVKTAIPYIGPDAVVAEDVLCGTELGTSGITGVVRYNDQNGDVVPGTWSWKSPQTVVSKTIDGTAEFDAIFTPNNNLCETKEQKVTIKVIPKTFEIGKDSLLFVLADGGTDYTIDLSKRLPEDGGQITYTIDESQSDYGAIKTANVNTNGILTCTIKNELSVGDTAKIVVRISMDYYADIIYELKITISSDEKVVPIGVFVPSFVGTDHLLVGETLDYLIFAQPERAFIRKGSSEVIEGTISWMHPEMEAVEAGTLTAVWVFTPNRSGYIPYTGECTIPVQETEESESLIPVVSYAEGDMTATVSVSDRVNEIHFYVSQNEEETVKTVVANGSLTCPELYHMGGFLHVVTSRTECKGNRVTYSKMVTTMLKPVYVITFDGNGATSGEMSNITCSKDRDYELGANRYYRPGYVFEGWVTTQNASNVAIEDCASVNNDILNVTRNQQTVTLYAKWRTKYIVTAPTSSVETSLAVPRETKVQLSCETIGANIYYTLDGTTPTVNSKLYLDAITITGNTVIRAIAIKENYQNSKVVDFSYSVIDESSNWGDVQIEDRSIYRDGTEVPHGLWLAGVQDCEYTGKNITFTDLRVYDYKTLLTEKVDYTVSYRNNRIANDVSNAKKTPAVIITGKGNYTGRLEKTFRILPVDLDDECIRADDVWVAYHGRAQKPSLIVYWNGKKLRAGTDYTVPQDRYTDSGDYAITLTGKGNYQGTRTVMYHVTQATLMSKLRVSSISNQNYQSGTPITPVPQVFDRKQKLTGVTQEEYDSGNVQADYSYKYENNTDAGVASIVLTGHGDYAGSKTITFKIIGTDIRKVTVNGLNKNGYVYTGEPIEPENVSLSYGGKTLVKDVDYQVSYPNLKNINVGTATIQFEGKKGFSGTIKKTFKIVALDVITSGKISVTCDEEVNYRKGGCKPEPVVTFNNVELKKGKDYTLSYKNNTKVASSSVAVNKRPTVTVQGKGNFKGKIMQNFTIVQSDISSLTMTAADRIYARRGNIYKSTPVITDLDGKKLSAGRDYDNKNIKYLYNASSTTLENGDVRTVDMPIDKKDILPAGTEIRVVVQGKGNYIGEIETIYSIVSGDISRASVTIPNQTYSGEQIRPLKSDMTVKIGKTILKDSDYEIIGYGENIKQGTGTVIIQGTHRISEQGTGMYGGTKTVKFRIARKKI